MLQYTPYNKKLARDLRKNMTDAERFLWSKLRRKQLDEHQWYRQRPIGPYIVDFYCPELSAIIEVDGGQHYEQPGTQHDARRNVYLSNNGLRVIRFTNIEVLKNIEGALLRIKEIPLNPPLQKGEE